MPFSLPLLQHFIERYGYTWVDMPLIEPAGLFLNKAGDQIIERLFTFDHHGWQLALRPEFTASAADHYIRLQQSGALDQAVVRWQFSGAVFEDVPGSGAQDYQHHSVGGELIGLAGSNADAEIISIVALGLQAQGLTPDDYQIMIGHVGLTRLLLGCFDLDDRALRFLLNHRTLLQSGEKVRVVEQLDRYLLYRAEPAEHYAVFGEALLTPILGNRAMGGRTNEDIARRLQEKQQRAAHRDQIIAALDFLERWGAICARPETAFARITELLEALEARTTESSAWQVLEEWRATITRLTAYDLPTERLLIQPDLARSWDYYTGMVFEVRGRNGQSLAGGGRYDELIRLMGGVGDVPAVGFAYYLDEVAALLDKPDAPARSVIFTMSYQNEQDNAAIAWAQRLRALGVSIRLLPTSQSADIQVMDGDQVEAVGKRFRIDQIDALVKSLESTRL